MLRITLYLFVGCQCAFGIFGDSSNVMILFAEGPAIKALEGSSGSVTTVHDEGGSATVLNIEYDAINKFVYWTYSRFISRLLYFSTTQSTKTIEKCKLDGTERQEIIITDGLNTGARGIALGNDKVYWTENYNWNDTIGYLRSANLDGSDVQLLYTESIYFWSFQLHNGFSYLSTFLAGLGRGNIYKSDSIEQLNRTSLYSGGIRGIIIILDESSNVIILFAEGPSIKALEVSSGSVTTLYDEGVSATVRNIEYDDTNKFVYWTYGRYISRISYPPETNSTMERVVTGNSVLGIALDVPSAHLYWAEYYNNRIMRSDLDGSNIITVLSNVPRPLTLTIDIPNGFLYFSTTQSTKKIEKCKLDGTERLEIIRTDGVNGGARGIALGNDKMYWTENYNWNDTIGYLRSANLDGSDVELLYTESIYFWCIQLHNGFSYLSTFLAGLGRGNIYKIDSTEQFTPASLYSGGIRGMVIIPKQTTLDNGGTVLKMHNLCFLFSFIYAFLT